MDEPTNGGWRQAWLGPGDQRALTAWVLVILAVASVWWRATGGLGGGRTLIDAAEPLSARFVLDVNAATLPQLCLLPGIGPKLAERWIALRDAEGPFATVDAVDRVPGIGPATLAKIRPFLTCRDDAAPLAPGP
jgi:competence ComEA-like helix-hairpin-helix protein